jgi:hypothetical protein
VRVLQVGVDQAVDLPGPGEYLVIFRYRPSAVEEGLVLSAVTGAALLLWGAGEIWQRRRRGRSERSSTATPALSPD